MPDKMIKKLSRRLNEKAYLRSFSIVLCRFSAITLFCAFPYLIIKICELTGIRNYFNGINGFIFPVFAGAVFLLAAFRAFCLFSSFSLGENAWYSGRLTRKKQCGKRLRFWFRPKLALKALRLSFLLFAVKTMWTAALLSPSMLVFSAVIGFAATGGIELYLFISLTVGGVILLFTGLIFRFIIIQRYFLAPYLLAEEPRMKPIQAIKQSKNLLDGHIYRIVCFKLKFLPSFMLYPFILPAIFFYPNYKQSCSVLAKEIRL